MENIEKIEQMVKEKKITEEQARLLREAYQTSQERSQKFQKNLKKFKKQRARGIHYLVLCMVGGCVLLAVFLNLILGSKLSGAAFFFLIIFLVLIITCVWSLLLLFYNGLVKKEENVFAGWGNVEAEYQRRSDLIPALLDISKDYARHERETFNEVITARNNLQTAFDEANQIVFTEEQGLDEIEKAQSQLDLHLKKIYALAEKYPDLKANMNFLTIQNQLEQTENSVTLARRRFNNHVKDYNNATRRFPSNLMAAMFKFEPKAYFIESD